MTWVSVPSVSEIIRAPGFLFWNPSALTNESTWGTKLGYTDKGVDLFPGINVSELGEEETGNEVTMIVETGNRSTLETTLQSWNTTALARAFPGMVTGTNVKSPGSYKAGKFYHTESAVYGQLLFVPDDQTNNPCIILQKAVPRLIQRGVIKMSHGQRLFLALVFSALRKSSDADGIFFVGKLSDGVLR